MDPGADVDFDLSPFLIRYKSGRVRRLVGTTRVTAGPDARTSVTSKDVVIDAGTDLRARLFIPTGVLATSAKLPVVLYIHGGLFVVQSAFSPSYTALLNALVSAARVVAVSVEYRLAPEHPIPAAHDDCWAALTWAVAAAAGSGRPAEPWLAHHGDLARLFVAGESAGANIAHQVVLRAGRRSGGELPGGARIDGMVLMHPYFRGEELVPSEGTDRWRLLKSRRIWGLVCAGKYPLDHPFMNPLTLSAEDWAALGCRRAMVTVAKLDDLSDRGRSYVEALQKSSWPGEEVVLYETEGEDHVYFLEKGGGLDRAAKELAAVASFIASSGKARRGGPCVRSSVAFDAKL